MRNAKPLPRPSVGAPAPVVGGVRADGGPWSSADHLGRHLVLVFHRHIH
ncbi:MAG: hypothetical protein AAF962_05645 [Actinomycetota bacterium]